MTPNARSPISAAVVLGAGEVGERDAGTAGVEAAGEGGADAAAGPGDDDVTILEIHGRRASRKFTRS